MGIIDYVRSRATPPKDIKPIEHIPSTMPDISLSTDSVCYLNDLLRLQQKYHGKIPSEVLQRIYEVVAKLMGVPDHYFDHPMAAVGYPVIQGGKTRKELVLEYQQLLDNITSLGKLDRGGIYSPEVEEEIANLIRQATAIKLQLMDMDGVIVEKQHENVTPEGVIDLDTVTEMY